MLVVGADLASPAYPCFTPSGALAWASMYEGTGNDQDEVGDMVQLPDGDLLAIGSSWSGNGYDATLVRFDVATGANSALASLDVGGTDSGTSLALSPDSSRVYIGGSAAPSGGSRDAFLAAVDVASGAVLWTRVIDDAGFSDELGGIAVTPDGARIVAPITAQQAPVGGFARSDYLVHFLDATDGSTVATDRIDASISDWASDAVASSDGTRVYVGGYRHVFPGPYLLVTYETTGWTRTALSTFGAGTTFGGPGPTLAISPDGSAVASRSLGSGQATAVHEADGSLRWTAADGVFGWDVAWTPDGTRVVAVASSYAGSEAPSVRAYDAGTGALAWAQSYALGSESRLNSIVMSPQGDRAYLVGHARLTIFYDIYLAAINVADGARAWTQAFHNQYGEFGSEVFLSADGTRVFAGGSADSRTTYLKDYTLLSYRTSAPPAAPCQPSAARGGGPGRIDLAWYGPDDAGTAPITSFGLYRAAPGGAFAWFASRPAGADPAGFQSASATGLVENTTYSFRVTAVNAVGESAPSTEASARTPARPYPPTSPAARPGNDLGTLRVSWQPPEDDGGLPITGYRLYRGIGAAEPTLFRSLTASARTFLDQDLIPLQDYHYRIAAVNAVGEGSRATEVCSAPSPYNPQMQATFGECPQVVP